MFDIGWSELLLIGIVALIVIGPKELPSALRTLGQWTAKLRRMAAEFQGQFHEAMREAEMADLKKQVDDLTGEARSYASFDPVADVRKEFENTQEQIERAVSDQRGTSPPATPQLPAQQQQSSDGSTAAGSGREPVSAQNAETAAASSGSTPQPATVADEPGHQHAGGKPA